MPDGFQSVSLLGDVFQVDLTQTQNSSVLKIRMAVTETYRDRNNTPREKTEYIDVTLWGRRAEGLAPHIHKGDRLFIEGPLRTTTFQKDGVEHRKTEVNASKVVFASSKSSPLRSGARGARSTGPEPLRSGARGAPSAAPRQNSRQQPRRPSMLDDFDAAAPSGIDAPDFTDDPDFEP